MIKAFIFDFDGVLVLSEGPRFKGIKTVAARHGIRIEKQAQKNALGKTTLHFLQQIIPDDPEMVQTIIKEFRAEYVENITSLVEPIPFTVDFIREYKGPIPISIASMSSRYAIEKVTKHLGIFARIAHIITRDDVTNHKPNPEIYLKTATILNAHPEACLVFEDTVVGVEAARNAEMSCCVVLNGFNKKSDFKNMDVLDFVSDKQSLLAAIGRL